LKRLSLVGQDDMTKRSFLGWVVALVAMVAAGIVALPTLVAGLSPILQGRRREVWRPLGRLQDFSIGAIVPGQVDTDYRQWPRTLRQHAVYVWRRSESELVVYSRSCTDLGCPVNYDAGSACFFCPCHGGVFDRDGRRLAGPPNRPLDRLAHRLRDGILEVDVTSVPPNT
jgi:Rieske Fe-S protein